MKAVIVFLIFLSIACSKNIPTPAPRISNDAKAERAATLDSFVGEWVKYINEEPYEKIIIEKTTIYSFKHYVSMGGTFKLDEDWIFPQELSSASFVPWDKSANYRPYIIIKSKGTSYGSQSLHYRVDSGKIYLGSGVDTYVKN